MTACVQRGRILEAEVCFWGNKEDEGWEFSKPKVKFLAYFGEAFI